MGHLRSHTKFGPVRFSRFDAYWIQTNRQAEYIYTRLLGRFAPIFYFNGEHFLFRKTKTIKKLIFKKIVDFYCLIKIEFCWRQIFKIFDHL